MTLTRPQMQRWKDFLALWKEEIRENCRGAPWDSHYDPNRQ